MNAHTQIKLNVNTNRLFANLGSVFSDAGIVLRELVQNGRRAGSDSVDISACINEETEHLTVSIRDYGKGIDDFQSLLCLADSSWSEDIVENENAFGMGFFSVFFCCEKVRISSNNMLLNFDCKHMIEGGTVAPESSNSDITQGTLIELIGFHGFQLQGVTLDAQGQFDNVQRTLVMLAKGDETIIRFNYEELDAPSARRSIQNRVKYNTSFGEVFIMPSLEGEILLPTSRYHHIDPTIFLQGINVYGKNEPSSSIIVHLNDDTQARMPDRDRLIHEKDVKNQIIDFMHLTYASSFISGLKSAQADSEEAYDKFLDKYWFGMKCFCPEVLNGLDRVPSNLIHHIDYPVANGDQRSTSLLRSAETAISRADLSSMKILPDLDVLLDSDNFDAAEADYTLAMWAYAAEYPVIESSDFPKGHWIFDMLIKDINRADATISFNTYREPVTFDGNRIYKPDVTFCDFVEITFLGETYTIKDAFVGGNGIIVPSMETTGDVVNQLCSFIGEWEEYLERDAEEEKDLFFNFMNRQRAYTPAGLLKILLGNISQDAIDTLEGKSFSLTFGVRDEGVHSWLPEITVSEI